MPGETTEILQFNSEFKTLKDWYLGRRDKIYRTQRSGLESNSVYYGGGGHKDVAERITSIAVRDYDDLDNDYVRRVNELRTRSDLVALPPKEILMM